MQRPGEPVFLHTPCSGKEYRLQIVGKNVIPVSYTHLLTVSKMTAAGSAPSPALTRGTPARSAQNAISQAREFCKAANATGIILTKLDGTAKGGCCLLYTSTELTGVAGRCTNFHVFLLSAPVELLHLAPLTGELDAPKRGLRGLIADPFDT